MDDNETRADLTTSVHEQLRVSEDEFELLREDVADIEYAETHANSQTSLRRTTSGRQSEKMKELAKTRTRFRRAQLTAKANAERFQRRERTLFLSSLQSAAAAAVTANATQSQAGTQPAQSLSQEQVPKYTDLFAGRRPRPSPHPTSAVQDDILLTSQADITSSLRRTQNLLQSELSRSQFAQETLDASNEALKELNQRYDTFDDLISKSRGLLGTLLRSQKSDTWYLETTCWLLLGVIAWLVFRRWIYGPFWWFFWMPIKLLYNMLWMCGYALGVTGRNTSAQGLDVVGTTTIASVTSSPVPSAPTATYDEDQGDSSVAADTIGSPPGSLSEAIGRMVESSSQASPVGARPPNQQESEDVDTRIPNSSGDVATSQQVRQEAHRGDGQILPERDEATQPRNPKKRMLEEPGEERSADDSRQASKEEL
ncbi:MAG: hypothetical protein Q9162_000651 [Coniocarpon cinnabarinum]